MVPKCLIPATLSFRAPNMVFMKDDLPGSRKTLEASAGPVRQRFELAFCGVADRAWLWGEPAWDKGSIFLSRGMFTYLSNWRREC